MTTQATTSVLFLCSANSARSQLAEALLRHLGGGRFVVFSAGTHPQSVDPRVFEVLAKLGVDSSNLVAKSADQLPRHQFDLIITLCDSARQECPPTIDGDSRMHWDFGDPKASVGSKAFELVAQGLLERLQLFVLINDQQGERSPVELFKALSDEIRLKTLLLLEDERELCVCELVAALAEPQPKISRHLALLRESGIVCDRRQGQWVYYRLNPKLPGWLVQLLRATRIGNRHWLAGDQQRLTAMTSRPGRDGSCSTNLQEATHG